MSIRIIATWFDDRLMEHLNASSACKGIYIDTENMEKIWTPKFEVLGMTYDTTTHYSASVIRIVSNRFFFN